MMTYVMPRPSDNMKKSLSELAAMSNKQKQERAEQEATAKALSEAAINREIVEQANTMREIMQEQDAKRNDHRAFLNNFKSSLLSECMMSLFKHSCVWPMSESDNVMAKNLVHSFIKDNGVSNLLTDFKLKNQLLSEYASLVNKYYNKAINEGCKKDCPEEDRPAIGLEPKEYSFDTTIANDFFDDLADVDDEEVSHMIKTRVADAINEFIDDNAESRIEYEDIIKDAQDKIDRNKNITEESANAYISQAKRKINESKLIKYHNAFHYLVENLTKGILKDDDLRKRYVNESKVDMDSVVNSATLIYTMLEMANTTGMLDVNEEYIKNYITNLDR